METPGVGVSGDRRAQKVRASSRRLLQDGERGSPAPRAICVQANHFSTAIATGGVGAAAFAARLAMIANPVCRSRREEALTFFRARIIRPFTRGISGRIFRK